MQPRPCPSARIPAWAGRRVASCFDLASPRGGGRNRPRIAPGDTDCRPWHMAGRRRCPPGPGATAIAPSTTRVFPSPPARGAQLRAFAGRTCADQAAWNLRHTAGGEGLSALDEASAYVNAHDPLLTPYPSAANVAASRRSCTTRGPSVRCRGQQCPVPVRGRRPAIGDPGPSDMGVYHVHAGFDAMSKQPPARRQARRYGADLAKPPCSRVIRGESDRALTITRIAARHHAEAPTWQRQGRLDPYQGDEVRSD